jgi:hypothetical protein
MYEMLKEFIKPELLVLIPVLYLFGVALKKSQISDKHIPWVLGVVSVVLSSIFIAATSDINGYKEVLMAIFSGLTQGILCAGASVYVNQVIKQSGKSN